MKKVNEMYEAPYLEVAECELEQGIALSYGVEGAAGHTSGFIGEEVDPESESGMWI